MRERVKAKPRLFPRELLSHSAEKCREAKGKLRGKGECYCWDTASCRTPNQAEKPIMQLLVMVEVRKEW